MSQEKTGTSSAPVLRRGVLRQAPFVFALLFAACAEQQSAAPHHAATAPAAAPASVSGIAAAPAAPAALGVACDMATARPAIERWFAAWSLASEQLLKLPDAPPPQILLFDSPCAYTTSGISAGTAPSVDGPALRGVPMAWHVLPHGDSLLLPNGSSAPVALMSFASSTPQDGPFFVMALPSYWAEAGHSDPSDFTAVFLHEFSHTRQIEGMGPALGPIDASWPFPEELDDDAVQTHFKDDPEYVTAYLAERDLLYRAADAATVDEARALAAEALKMMRTRHARWFVGDKAVFTKVDDIFLALEGVGQWTAYAWLAQPDGGSLDRPAAIAKMLGTRRWWSQDEGLALLLAVDRLLPGWPALEFSVPSLGATELLARAVKG